MKGRVMSTWVSLTVDGLVIEEFQNNHPSWFFKKSDRVREIYPRDEDGDVSEKEFIGYRATAASIRRRLALAGYDIEACKTQFLECRDGIVEALEAFFRETGSCRVVEDSANTSISHCWEYYLAAVKDSHLEDWISLLPEAVRLKRQQSEAGYNYFTNPHLSIISSTPLINAMLCRLDFNTTYAHTGPMNFPCNDINHFVTAFLESSPKEAVFELNIESLIRSGYLDDFTDLEEIQQEETQPHAISRESIEEILRLSAIQHENSSLQRMCYVSIITAMEAYLGDILRCEIFSRPTVKERFVASYEPFKKMKFTLAELYTRLSAIDGEIKDALNGLSLHKIDTAKKIFSSTLMAEFPAASLPFLGAAVEHRHHIVHRNGRDTDGEQLLIGHHDVAELALKVMEFTRAIDKQILDGLLRDHKADRE